MKPSKNVYVRLVGYLVRYKPQLLFGYASMFVASLITLIVPQIVKSAIDSGLAAGHASALVKPAGLILGMAVVRGIVAFGQRYCGEWLTHRVAYDLRNDFFNAIQLATVSFYDGAHTGDLMSRATSDTAETERFIGMGLMDLTSVVMLSIGVGAAMFWEDASLALLAIGPIVFLFIMSIRFARRVRPMFKAVQEQMGFLATRMQESLTGITVVKSFARERHEFETFDRENEAWFQRRYKGILEWGNNWPVFSFSLAASVFLLLWFGGPKAIAGTISVGSLFAMIWYVLMLNGPSQRLGFLVNLAATAGASASRVFDVIDTPKEMMERSDAVTLDSIRGDVVFDGVGFGYHGGDRIVDNLHFHVKAGQTVALIGPTGSGKSTIINLLLRFYDPTEGIIMIDAVDLRDMRLRDLRHHVGAVMQDIFLFSTTIRENISYGVHGAGDEEIVAAAEAANAHDFISGFVDGYDTLVGERGVSLSGGQKQRVAIARALLRNPRILLLDDSTSNVDTETEYQILQALARLMEERTTFVIAHRLLTLKGADQIFVLDNGGIIERGTHAELVDADGAYRELYDLQLRSQEEFI
jgi:ATP-binding cassette subfamily B protein|tara:strand:+ start:1210 stop:2958 length:1749 start_codon:yes stop_codon:yes gene_type:complete